MFIISRIRTVDGNIVAAVDVGPALETLAEAEAAVGGLLQYKRALSPITLGKNLVTALLLLPIVSPAPAFTFQDKWAQAQREIKRLPPSSFAQLPVEVVKQLEELHCKVPQAFMTAQPHNVSRGEFARKGQTDWAVLCSKNERSSILVFWGKPTKCPGELEPVEDKVFLQEIGDNQIGYSRMINPVSGDLISKRYKRYGGLKPPSLDHQGIDDQFVEKASVVHYCHDGKWQRLIGSD